MSIPISAPNKVHDWWIKGSKQKASDITKPDKNTVQPRAEKAPPFHVSATFSEKVPYRDQAMVLACLNIALNAINDNLTPEIRSVIELSGRKVGIINNTIIFRIGKLDEDLKIYTNKDTKDFLPDPRMKMDALTVFVLPTDESVKEVKVVIFLDYFSLNKGNKIATWLVTLNHEISGHLPLILSGTTKNGDEEEYRSYHASNQVLKKIIGVYKEYDMKGEYKDTINDLESLLKREQAMEMIFYKKCNLHKFPTK